MLTFAIDRAPTSIDESVHDPTANRRPAIAAPRIAVRVFDGIM
jgi:hypothetical protein